MRTKRDIYASELAMLPFDEMDNPASDFVIIPAGTAVTVVEDEGDIVDITWADPDGWLYGSCGAYVMRVDLED